MSPHHAAGLQRLDEFRKNEIIHLRDRFAEDTPDIDWISELGDESDWIIVSGDVRITKNPIERKVWIESGLTGFFFGDAWSKSAYWKKAADLVGWWPRITDRAKANPARHGFLIPKDGYNMRQLFP